jgi:hypothetical protein
MTWIERYDAQLRRSALRLGGAILGMVVLCGLFIATQRYLANAVRSWIYT